MLIICPKCSAKYKLPDDISLKDGQKLKCSACGHIFEKGMEAPLVLDQKISEIDPNTQNGTMGVGVPLSQTSFEKEAMREMAVPQNNQSDESVTKADQIDSSLSGGTDAVGRKPQGNPPPNWAAPENSSGTDAFANYEEPTHEWGEESVSDLPIPFKSPLFDQKELQESGVPAGLDINPASEGRPGEAIPEAFLPVNEPAPKKSTVLSAILVVVYLIIIAGFCYAAWIYRDMLKPSFYAFMPQVQKSFQLDPKDKKIVGVKDINPELKKKQKIDASLEKKREKQKPEALKQKENGNKTQTSTEKKKENTSPVEKTVNSVSDSKQDINLTTNFKVDTSLVVEESNQKEETFKHLKQVEDQLMNNNVSNRGQAPSLGDQKMQEEQKSAQQNKEDQAKASKDLSAKTPDSGVEHSNSVAMLSQQADKSLQPKENGDSQKRDVPEMKKLPQEQLAEPQRTVSSETTNVESKEQSLDHKGQNLDHKVVLNDKKKDSLSESVPEEPLFDMVVEPTPIAAENELVVQDVHFKNIKGAEGHDQLLIEGAVQNKAVSLRAIPVLTATIYGADEKVLATKKVHVTQDQINPGEIASFYTGITPAPTGVVRVEVDF